jgi:hypothetical protein
MKEQFMRDLERSLSDSRKKTDDWIRLFNKRCDRIEGSLMKIEENMITRDYLDEKFEEMWLTIENGGISKKSGK